MEYRVLMSFSIVVSIVCHRSRYFFHPLELHSFEHWKSTASSTLFCCLLVCIFFFCSSFSFSLIICKFSWSLWLFLLEFIRRGLLHWSVVSVGACVNTLTARCQCRDGDDIVVSARAIYSPLCVKISKRKHIAVVTCICKQAWAIRVVLRSWLSPFVIAVAAAACYRAHVLKWNMQMGT